HKMKVYIERTLLTLALLFAYSDALYLGDFLIELEQGRFTYECSFDFATLHFKPDTSYAVGIIVDKNKPECRKYFKNNSYHPPAFEVNFSNCTSGVKIFDVLLVEFGVFEKINIYYQKQVDCQPPKEQFEMINEVDLSKVKIE
ncbi:Protein of unknown function, partial [Cotesia congregata]